MYGGSVNLNIRCSVISFSAIMPTPCKSLVVLRLHTLIRKLEKCACRSGTNIRVSELGAPLTDERYAYLANRLQTMQIDTADTRHAEPVDDAVQAFASIAFHNYLAASRSADPRVRHLNRVTVC